MIPGLMSGTLEELGSLGFQTHTSRSRGLDSMDSLEQVLEMSLKLLVRVALVELADEMAASPERVAGEAQRRSTEPLQDAMRWSDEVF